ncbi:hypothetical protein [Clostridium tarantellae]|uniref:Uncharacterized protein n=1 Tax=Clostridium tarantellae TaxID=39493 RepID=A0A6I1MK79_9CLOT|nr:hypothetical protein [Clostridium tarantellae]MPQ42848.1 hypothetical protein [Clostridium tarantellae]
MVNTKSKEVNNKFKEIEDKIIEYYEHKKIFQMLKMKLKTLNHDIENLKERIKTGRIELNTDLSCQRYDKNGSSSNTPKGIEEEIEHAYYRLEKLLENKIVEAIETENKIYDINSSLTFITEGLEELKSKNSIHKEVLEMKYNEKYSMKYIANKFYYGATSTAYRDLKRILLEVETIFI